MRPDSCYSKKRKLFVTTAEDLGLPAPKHICCGVTIKSDCDLLYLKSVNVEDVEVLDTIDESAQDSNSLPGDSQSSTTEVTYDHAHLLRKTDSYDEASTSWANSRSVTSGNDNDLILSESENMRNSQNVDEIEDCQFSYQHNDGSGWNDIDVDGLEESISANYSKESKQQTADELEEFFSSTGVNTSLSMLSSEWNVDQEAQMGKQKPTIDQEFEQYFSSLML